MIPTRVPGLWGWGADFSRTRRRVRVTVTVTARARVHWQIYTPAGPGPGRGSGNFVWELLLGPNRAHQLLVGIGTISLAGSTVVTAATGSGRRY